MSDSRVTKTRLTLKDRTILFNESMRAKQNLVKPKSCNLSDMVSPIVANLENNFDNIKQRMVTKPSLDHEVWKKEALGATLKELPKIPLAGTETGTVSGFGDKLYVESSQRPNMKQTVPRHLLNKDGTWKSSVELRRELMAMNPTLPRSLILRANSGRYVWVPNHQKHAKSKTDIFS